MLLRRNLQSWSAAKLIETRKLCYQREKPLKVLLSRLPLLKLSTLGRYVVKFLKSKHLLSRHLSRQFALAAHLYFALLTFATFQCLNSWKKKSWSAKKERHCYTASLDRRDNFITCLLRWQPCFAAFQSNLKTKISNSAHAVSYFAGMLINIFFRNVYSACWTKTEDWEGDALKTLRSWTLENTAWLVGTYLRYNFLMFLSLVPLCCLASEILWTVK